VARFTRTVGALGVATTLGLGLLAPGGDVDAAVHPRRRVVAIVNVRRVEAGLRPLRLNADVHTAAQRHSRDQARRDLMTHTGANGSDAGDRISRAGYTWSAWGENVAMGYPTPRSVVRAWMHSSGHRANILTRRFRHLGVGRRLSADGTIYWTLDLARPAGSGGPG
jgi:uncharacterized protein YkwD